MNDAARPLPLIDDLNRPYWEAAQHAELSMQRCSQCAAFRYPPAPVCAHCGSADYEWARLSGRGSVNSFVVFHRAYLAGFDVPYAVALVDLEEGPKLYANLVDVPLDSITIGMPVEARFVPVSQDISLVQFARRR